MVKMVSAQRGQQVKSVGGAGCRLEVVENKAKIGPIEAS